VKLYIKKYLTYITMRSVSRKKVLVVLGSLIILVALAGTVLYIGQTHKVAKALPRTATVVITAHGFMPATLSVPKGTRIVWKNVDVKPHQVVSNPYPKDNGTFGLASKAIIPNSSYSFIPTNTVQTISYHDGINPKINAMIIVKQ